MTTRPTQQTGQRLRRPPGRALKPSPQPRRVLRARAGTSKTVYLSGTPPPDRNGLRFDVGIDKTGPRWISVGLTGTYTIGGLLSTFGVSFPWDDGAILSLSEPGIQYVRNPGKPLPRAGAGGVRGNRRSRTDRALWSSLRAAACVPAALDPRLSTQSRIIFFCQQRRTAASRPRPASAHTRAAVAAPPGFSDPSGKKLRAGAALMLKVSIPPIKFDKQPFTIGLPTPGMVPAVSLTVRRRWGEGDGPTGDAGWGRRAHLWLTACAFCGGCFGTGTAGIKMCCLHRPTDGGRGARTDLPARR
jgi:hypothetical protein